MTAGEASGTGTLVRAWSVGAHAFVLANGGRGGAFICVIKASGTCVAGRAGTFVATAGQSCAHAAVSAWTGEADVLKLTARSCPSSRTLTLELVQRRQDTDPVVGARVFGVAGGVLRGLAVLACVSDGTGAGGVSQDRDACGQRHRAAPSVQAVTGQTGVLVVAVLSQKAGRTPAVSSSIVQGHTCRVVHTRLLIVHALQSQRDVNETRDNY